MPETLTDAQKVLRNDTGIRMAAALEALASEVDPSTVIAPEYDPTLTYAVGDLVMRRSVLYRCTTPIDTPEEWTAAHWTATSVSDEYRPAAEQDVIDANLMALGLTGASVGDLVRVAAVDTNGKPTSWETVPLLNNAIKKWDVKTNGKIVFLGNSYGKNYTNYPNMPKWPERTAEYLGLESHALPTSDNPIAVDPTWEWFNVCRRSYSLYGTDGTTGAFITYLQQWVANNPNIDYNNIGAVVLVAGINDARQNRTDHVLSCLSDLATYIRGQMPNAVLYNGYCGWLDESRKASTDTHGGQLYQQNVAHEYMAGKQYGWNYLTGIENVFHDKADMADYLHPNENGSKVIGLAVANALCSGSCSVVKTQANVTAQGLDGADGRTYVLDNGTATSSAATVNNGNIRQWIQDNIIHSQWASLEFNISPALTMAYNHIYTLGTIDVPYSNQVDFGNQMLMCRTDTDSKGITGIICRVYVQPRSDQSGKAVINFQVKGFADGSESKNVVRMVRFVADSFKQTLSD